MSSGTNLTVYYHLINLLRGNAGKARLIRWENTKRADVEAENLPHMALPVQHHHLRHNLNLRLLHLFFLMDKVLNGFVAWRFADQQMFPCRKGDLI